MDYEIEKGGKPTLFLHGWGGDKNSFKLVVGWTDCENIFLSMPGFGKTPPPEQALSVGDYAEQVFDFVSGLGYKKVSIVCHSFGARVAAKLCTRHPEFVDKLFIVGGAGLKPRHGLGYYIRVVKYRRTKKRVERGKLEASALEKFGSADYRALSGVMRETFCKVVNEDLSKDFKKIRVPTLLMYGEKDTETPLYMGRRLRGLISGSALIKVKGAGHFCYLERPDLFLAVLKAFI